jgi:uncharacterized protein (TIGR00661 family)
MKILYGIQGTGNGHLSRARAMAKHLIQTDADVTYLFSGRPHNDYFGMETFGKFETRSGLTFSIDQGKVQYLKTALHNNVFHFIRDVKQLNIDEYDIILNDFEPISAWAGKLRQKTVINLGHQSAFKYDIPVAGSNFLARIIFKYFAPGDINLGLHWYHFNQPILPPIINLDTDNGYISEDRKILVYLPFENQDKLIKTLQLFVDHEFYVYAKENVPLDFDNIHIRPFSVHGFQYDLATSNGVMCHAGFELPSECLYLGKKLLLKPVHNQMEQYSNAFALQQLKLGQIMNSVDCHSIEAWLDSKPHVIKVDYPDVAYHIVQWILDGNWNDVKSLSDNLWKKTSFYLLDRSQTDNYTCDEILYQSQASI